MGRIHSRVRGLNPQRGSRHRPRFPLPLVRSFAITCLLIMPALRQILERYRHARKLGRFRSRQTAFLFLAKFAQRSHVATVFDYRARTIFLSPMRGRCGRADKDDRGWLSGLLDIMPTKYRPRLILLNLCTLVKHDPFRSHGTRCRCYRCINTVTGRLDLSDSKD